MIRAAIYLALLTSLAGVALGFPGAKYGLAPRSDGAAEGSQYLRARATPPRSKFSRVGLKPQRQETARRYKKSPGSLRASGRTIKTKNGKRPSGMEMAKAAPRKRSSVNKELKLVLEGLGL